MIEDIIIIIPTHNRQHYLRRVIKYYSEFPCKVYICDSSKEKADVESCGTIIYRWVPQSNFYGKVLDVLNETSADFYALSPDDDFLKQETLMECYEALKENEEYSFGTGKQVFFKEGLNGGLYTKESSNKLQGINEITFDQKNEYVKFFWNHYQNILWSIFRKGVIKAAFYTLKVCNYSNGNFVEITLGIEALRKGTVYVSLKGLNYREVLKTIHWGNSVLPITRLNIKEDKALYDDIVKFTDHYKDDGFASFCIESYLRTSDTTIWKTRVKSMVKKLLPSFIRSQIIKQKQRVAYKEEKLFQDQEMCLRINSAIEQ